jgi:hypothetical protein
MYHTINYLPRMEAVTEPDDNTKLVYVAAWDGNMGSGCEFRDSRREAATIMLDWALDKGSEDKLYFFEATVSMRPRGEVNDSIYEVLEQHIEENTDADDDAVDPRYEDNISIVKKIMTYSRYGALSQAFVVEAIGRYADQCAKMTDDEVEKHDREQPLLSYKAWRGVAQEIKAVMDKRYNRNRG